MFSEKMSFVALYVFQNIKNRNEGLVLSTVLKIVFYSQRQGKYGEQYLTPRFFVLKKHKKH